MPISTDVTGPYIVWENYGYEGWKPREYATLEEALLDGRTSSEWVITKRVVPEIMEKKESEPC